MFKTLFAASAVIALGAPVAAAAQDGQDGPRVYGTLGYSRIDTEQAELGAVTARIGYKFLPHIGVEGEASFGVEDESFDVSIGGSGGVIELKHDVAAYAVAYLPLGEHFEIFARAGYGSTVIESSEPSVSVRADGESFNYGAGVSAFYGKNGLRADWTRKDYTEDAGEADVVSLSYVRRF